MRTFKEWFDKTQFMGGDQGAESSGPGEYSDRIKSKYQMLGTKGDKWEQEIMPVQITRAKFLLGPTLAKQLVAVKDPSFDNKVTRLFIPSSKKYGYYVRPMSYEQTYPDRITGKEVEENSYAWASGWGSPTDSIYDGGENTFDGAVLGMKGLILNPPDDLAETIKNWEK